MGQCCSSSKSQVRPTRAPSHLRKNRINSTFKQIKSVKDQSQLTRNRHLYRLDGNRLMIYNIDMQIAWVEEVSMRDRVVGRYTSVKTGPNQLFVLQGSLALLIDVDLFTAVRKPDPPFFVTRSSLGYFDRKVYVAGDKLMVLDLDTDTWQDVLIPSNYSLESGCFLLENKLYIIGGIRDNVCRREVLVYSLLARSWLSSTVELPIPMRLPTCVPMTSGTVLICCAFTQNNTPLPQAFIFDLFKFQAVANIGLQFLTQPLMSICYHKTCFVLREDATVACFQAGYWLDIDAEAICNTLAGETQESNREMEDLDRAKAMIPKRPPRADRLYCYIADFDENRELRELNTLSLESKVVNLEKFEIKIPQYAGFGLLANGKVIVAGGVDDQDREVETCLEYDGAAGTLTAMNSLPSPQAFVSLTCTGDKAYALGSRVNSYHPTSRRLPVESYFQELSLITGEWMAFQAPEYPLLHSSICHLGSSIFSLGGICKVQSKYEHCLIFDFSLLETRVWRLLDIKYPAPAGHLTVVNTLQNRLISFGGVDLTSGTELHDTVSFDGKGFKTRGRATYRGKRCMSCLGYKTQSTKIFSVDISGHWHRFAIDTGVWEHEQ